MKRTICAVFMAVTLMASLPWGLAAQPEAEFGLQSSTGESLEAVYFQLEPGESERTSLQSSGSEADLRIASVTSPPNGGISILGAASPDREPASWLSLEGGSGANRTLTAAVPENAEPGQYLAALVLEAESPGQPDASGDLPQRARAVTMVTITVTGEMEAGFSLGEPTVVSTGAVRLVIPLQNTGTVPVAPAGELTLQPAEGDSVTIPLALGVIVPGANTSVDLIVPAGLEPGEHEITLSLTDAASGVEAKVEPVSIDLPESTANIPPYADANGASAITIRDADMEFAGSPIASATVSAELANTGPPVANATVMLDVRRDGQVVESVPIVEFARITDGSVNFSVTYVPESTFTSGLWSFRLRLEVPGGNGEPETIAQTGTIAKIDVP